MPAPLEAGRQVLWDLPLLKDRFYTASHELIARRMLDLPPPVIMTLFDHGRLTWRRSNVPGRLPPLSPREQSCWHSAHASGEPAEADDGLDRVQAWPIHEPRWKRDIIRREVNTEP